MIIDTNRDSEWMDGERHDKSDDMIKYESFADFPGVPEWLSSNCENLNYFRPTVVQQKSIPV